MIVDLGLVPPASTAWHTAAKLQLTMPTADHQPTNTLLTLTCARHASDSHTEASAVGHWHVDTHTRRQRLYGAYTASVCARLRGARQA